MPTENLDAMMQADATAVANKPDKLDKLKKYVIEKRDLDLAITDAEESLKRKKEDRQRMEYETLPEVFLEAGVESFKLMADGNHPAAEYICRPHYYANISAEWEHDRREAGFDTLRELKWEDLIKNQYVIKFGRVKDKKKAQELAKQVKAMEAALRKLKIPFDKTQAVAWNSLTAAVRELYEKGQTLSDAQKRTLGATTGYVVKLLTEKKPREQKS